MTEDTQELRCDVCGKVITDYTHDLLHYSGKIREVVSGHIHLCAACDSEINPPKFDFDARCVIKEPVWLQNVLL